VAYLPAEMNRHRHSVLLPGAFCLGWMLACSSSSTPATKVVAKDAGKVTTRDSGSDSAAVEAGEAGSDAQPDVMVIIDNQDCVAPGTASNEEGLGGYCSPMGGQCVQTGLGGVATLCSGDLGAPAHEWFCTIPCSQTSDCGAGGGACLSAPFGQICVPTACAGNLGDAGSGLFDAGDAAPEAAASQHEGGTNVHDAATDAAHDAASSSHDAVSSSDGSGVMDGTTP